MPVKSIEPVKSKEPVNSIDLIGSCYIIVPQGCPGFYSEGVIYSSNSRKKATSPLQWLISSLSVGENETIDLRSY